MSQDTLSEVLRSVRLRGAVFYHVEGASSWVAEAPPAAAIGESIMPGTQHVMEYHVVTHGSCWGALVGEQPVRMNAGDVVVFPHGDAHVISSAPGMRAPANVEDYAMPRPAQMPFYMRRRGEAVELSQLAPGGTDASARLVCGFFGCDARPFNPLLASLPRLLHIRSREGGDEDWIGQFIRFAMVESVNKRPGGEALLERLSETMFVELLRRYLDEMPAGQDGWLAGLRDHHVGRALALLHASPADAWTIDQLADRVGLSRSALHERFAQFTGHAPMQYLANWRMQLAANLLRQSGSTIAAIALDVGYQSEAAFSRAFRRAVGAPPAAWRRQQAKVKT
jgi:AraC-like DNA-binding protein